jgi:hypothetical protein
LSGQDSIRPVQQPGGLFFNFKSISFIKNNEYVSPVEASKLIITSGLPWPVQKSLWIEGYTLTGFFLQPELVYKPSSKISIRGGLNFLKYSGEKKFNEVRPVFSASLSLTDHTSLTIGSLSGSDKHQMFDPHFNTERRYYSYVEDGFQLKTVKNNIFNDTWLSWEKYIVRTDTTREIFTFGESFRYTSAKFADFLQVDMPVQLQFKHFGGQISDYNEHVTTFFNMAAGIRVNADISHKRYGTAGIEYLRFINKVIPERQGYILNGGNADWLRLHYNYKALYVGASYWRGYDFYAPNGNSMYANVFDFNSGYIIHERKILNNSLFITFLPESYLELLFGIETYYDIAAGRLDHAMTLHLDFDRMFKINGLKNH